MSEPALAQPAAPDAPPSRSLRALPPPARQAQPCLEVPGYDLAAALKLERELGLSHVTAQILVRRGLADPTAAREFLDGGPTHPPSAFAEIASAVSVIQRHLAVGSRITIHGDYDVDGVCATALMVRALRDLGGSVDWVLPSRTEDGYGLTTATVDRLARRGTRLLITVDCGITAVEEVAHALASGIEVVVTDHHRPRPDSALPGCRIVHPAICQYPWPDLCATAVAYKLACALGAASAEADLDLVALATVADLMPLRGENRVLVRAGLSVLASTPKLGLQALMEVAGCDPSGLDAGALGFRLAPRINAAGRLARADACVELLLCADPARAREIALELDAHNAERRLIEERITWEAEAQVAELGERPAYVLAGEGWHPGVVGIVASRVAERYHRPAVLIALGGGDTAQGSGRSIPGFDLLSGLQACAAHLERFGGHRAAAGLTVRPQAVPELRRAFEAHAGTELTPELLRPVERIDAILCGSLAGLDLADELERLEPSGLGAPRPRLLIPGARVTDSRAMGAGRHARFTVLSGGTRTPAVAFGCEGRVDGQDEEALDASFRLERNCWNGCVEPRLVLRHAWPCSPPPIAVLGESDDYVQDAVAELARDLGAGRAAALSAVAEGPARDAGRRTELDRRGQSPLATLADAQSAGGTVLGVCADVPRRIAGLSRRSGGFSLISYYGLENDPDLARTFDHLVALDPPSGELPARLLELGHGFTHWAWGEPELRFAQHMHELEYGLRSHLAALYRALRPLGRATGGQVESLLRGDGGPGRPARLAGRLLRVLTELALVELDPDGPSLAIAGAAPTSLELSPAYRAYAKRHEDGRRFLTSGSLRPGG